MTHRIPSFDIVAPDGRRRVLVDTPAATVADLSVALGVAAPHALVIGGAVAGGNHRLVTLDALVVGARVEPVTSGAGAGAPAATSPVARPPAGPLEFAVDGGPSCRSWTPLPVGRVGIGRSPHATIRLTDGLVEMHHAMLDIGTDGAVRFTQLTGRVPVDGESLVVGASRLRLRRCEPGAPVGTPHHLGGSLARSATDPWRREVRRGPCPAEGPALPPITVPQPPPAVAMPAATGIVGALVGLGGALLMAVVLAQMLFALFALVGAVASLTTWLVGAGSAWRRRRRLATDARDGIGRFVEAIRSHHDAALERHRTAHPDIVDTLVELERLGARTWSRREPGSLRAVLGRGTFVDDVPLDGDTALLTAELLAAVDHHAQWGDVAIPITLAPGETVGVCGEDPIVESLVRSLVVQLATWVGPADLRIAVVSADPRRWDWAGWLPHCRDRRSDPMVFGPAELDLLAESVDESRRILLVVDDPSLLTVRTNPLRRVMGAGAATTLVAVDHRSTIPAVCSRTLRVGARGSADWTGPTPSGWQATDLRVAGIDEATALQAALRLAPLLDPEEADRGASQLPGELTLLDLGRAPDEHGVAERWRAGGIDPPLRCAIGATADGIVEIDLVGDGPHALVAGTTGSGKSELLRTLVVSLAGSVSPEHLAFVLIDYKGGATFDCCVDLPHTVGVVTDLDEGLAARALVGLDAELGRRERALRATGAGDLTQYRAAGHDREPIPRLVVVVDEFATLAGDLPDFLTSLVGIAQRGRSLGVHLVLATQRPGGVVNDDIRANTNLRIALRVNDRAEAVDVVGTDGPASFPRSSAGRAAVRLGADEVVEFQAARCTGPAWRPGSRVRVVAVGRSPLPRAASQADPTEGLGMETELAAAVDAIRRAVVLGGLRPPCRPWLDVLPAQLDHRAVIEVVEAERANSGETGAPISPIHDAIGLIDDPTGQCRRPLRWDRDAGNLVLVGSLGSGLTSTLIALVAATCRTTSPDSCHVYVIDASGDPMTAPLASIAHCGAVVRLGQHERVDRLLARLDAEVERRTAHPASTREPDIVLFVDGLPELRRALEPIERLPSLARLERILDSGPAVGIVGCVTTDGSRSAATVAASERWIFGVDEPANHPTVASRGAGRGGRSSGGAGTAGRLRVGSSGLEAQVAAGADGLAGLAPRSAAVGPADVDVLPASVDPRGLPVSTVERAPGRSIRELSVGISSDDLGPASLQVPDGDHLFVGGSARTGRSGALDRLADAWMQVEGARSVIRWHPDGAAALADRLAGRLDPLCGATLLVVDDADRVADACGILAAVVRGDHPAVTLAVAARLDAVRAAYGHWTREVARSRCGLIMTSPGELDGELLGAVLPRRSVIPARPGLAWLIDGRGHRLVQVAGRMPT